MALKEPEGQEGSSQPAGEKKAATDEIKAKDGDATALSRPKFAVLIISAFSAMFLVSLVRFAQHALDNMWEQSPQEGWAQLT